MREELRLLNALIGMTFPSSVWPNLLHELGFKLSSLQRDVAVVVGGRSRTLTPEAVFQSLRENFCLVVEAKSSTFDDDQARRYTALTLRDLVASGAAVEPPDVAAGAVGPTYFCQAIHTSTIQPRVEAFNAGESASLPLVDYDNHRFELQTGAIPHDQLHSDFERGVYFTENDWPTSFVPFDSESPIDDMRGRVLAELIAFLVNEEIDEFTVADLAGGSGLTGTDGCVPFFGEMGRSARRQTLGKVSRIIEEFRVHYLADTLSRLSAPTRWRKDRSVSAASMSSVQSKISDYCRRSTEGIALPRELQAERLITEEELELSLLPEEGER